MHSSRMSIARLLTVSHSIRGRCLPRGDVCLAGRWSVCPEGGGVSAQGGLSTRGGGVRLGWCLPGGGVSQHAMGQTPATPPVNGITERCKHITLPQTSFADGKKLK